jgi:hypothetical protein
MNTLSGNSGLVPNDIVSIKQAITASRQAVRAARRRSETTEPWLSQLYELQALRSFFIPYADRLREPAANVYAIMPPQVFLSLDLAYHQIGYGNLEASKTDVCWFIEVWGEPGQHSSAFIENEPLFRLFEDVLIAERSAALRDLRQTVDLIKRKGFDVSVRLD